MVEEKISGKYVAADGSLLWPGNRVRQAFIDHFVNKHKHAFVSSSPVVPFDDPTLLFTNAGMNQFKPVFLGVIDSTHEFAKYNAVANSQKCIRAGGKHNDLDDVGKDVYHHTFFEMLGNWSFGYYFKKEAIEMAWDLLVNTYKLDPKRIYATYFEGFKEQGIPADEQAKNFWLRFLPAERVLPFGMKDNFWEMGDTGPCGPCTEIHYDRIGGRDASKLVNADHPDVIEIWNLVFIQFNREQDGKLSLLPAQHVDTGMGFERITSILQDKTSNYDTDIFTPIFEAIEAVSGLPPEKIKYRGRIEADDCDHIDTAYRVVADHIRTLTFAITDGAEPSIKGRGYVLRKVVRRAVKYGVENLKAKPGFLHPLVDVVVDTMGDFFPELRKDPERVKAIIKEEEESFGKTLKDGMMRMSKLMKKLPKGSEISPEETFKLYATYGFPIDLTQRMAEEAGYIVSREGFEKRMEESREESRAATSFDRGGLFFEAEQIAELQKMNVPDTDFQPMFTWEVIAAPVMAIYNLKSRNFIEKAGEELNEVVVILQSTPFYAEAGGQVGDTGKLLVNDAQFIVEDVQSVGNYFLHIGHMLDGILELGDVVTCTVDYDRRSKIAPNHTMTHSLNWALRHVLKSDTIDQRGSMVDPEKSRFDFTGRGVNSKEIEEIETILNEMIKKDLKVYSKVSELKEAESINSLRAVFGEKYPDPVRVVSIGLPVEDALKNPEAKSNMNYSIEFCGGTHLSSLGEAKDLVILSEESVSKGVRRIFFVTHKEAIKAREHGRRVEQKLEEAKEMPTAEQKDACVKLMNIMGDEDMKIPYTIRKNVYGALEKLRLARVAIEKERLKHQQQQAIENVQRLAEKNMNAQYLVAQVEVGTNNKAMLKAIQAFHKINRIPVFFVSIDPSAKKTTVLIKAEAKKGGKKNINCQAWVKSVQELVNGRGGGKPLSATCNGTDHSCIEKVLQVAEVFAEKFIKE